MLEIAEVGETVIRIVWWAFIPPVLYALAKLGILGSIADAVGAMYKLTALSVTGEEDGDGGHRQNQASD